MREQNAKQGTQRKPLFGITEIEKDDDAMRNDESMEYFRQQHMNVQTSSMQNAEQAYSISNLRLALMKKIQKLDTNGNRQLDKNKTQSSRQVLSKLKGSSCETLMTKQRRSNSLIPMPVEAYSTESDDQSHLNASRTPDEVARFSSPPKYEELNADNAFKKQNLTKTKTQ